MPCPVSYYNSWHDVSVEEKKVPSANRGRVEIFRTSGSFHSWCSVDLNVLNLNESHLLD